jgi:hypothetical protein
MFEKTNYQQKVTYWAPIPGDSGTGAELVAAPKTVKVRWEDRQEQILNSRGQQQISKAQIFTSSDEPLEIDGFVYYGITKDLEPRNVPGAYQVIQILRIPDLRNLMAENVAII